MRPVSIEKAAAGPGGITEAQFEKLAAALEPSSAKAADPAAGAGAFQGFLGNMVREVQARQAAADAATAGVISRQGVPLHEAVLSSEEASVSFQLMVEVRNKLLESYQELMRMQV